MILQSHLLTLLTLCTVAAAPSPLHPRQIALCITEFAFIVKYHIVIARGRWEERGWRREGRGEAEGGDSWGDGDKEIQGEDERG